MATETQSRARATRPPVRATYRLQLGAHCGFAAARELVPDLAALGISHLYLSPCFEARRGSEHGYDVVAYDRFDPAIGTLGEFEDLVARLREHDMGVVLDLVPNHMGIMGSQNRWWLDVLEHGRASRHAAFFDIDWRPARASMRDRILVPVLGQPYGATLESGELKLVCDGARGAFHVAYHEHVFPLDPREYARILAPIDDGALAAMAPQFASLTPRTDDSEAARIDRHRSSRALQERLAAFLRSSAGMIERLEARVAALNGRQGDPSSYDEFDELLQAQAWRLAWWRVASDEINYRRFFDVNDLAALCVERPVVFDAAHAFTAELVARGLVDGVRIDHADGLHDPQRYFRDLRALLERVDPGHEPWIIAEKILGAREHVPDDWAIDGTTGYDFARLATTWLVDGAHVDAFTHIYDSFLGVPANFDAMAAAGKRRILETSLASEVSRLAARLDRIAHADRHTVDFSLSRLQAALIDALVYFPVYRTYATERGISAQDREHVAWAIARARVHAPEDEGLVYDFLERVLRLDLRDGDEVANDAAPGAALVDFVMRAQQVCAPAMAKGVEDTAFYDYNRFVALNEVGGDPRRFGLPTGGLHQANRERAERHPRAMLCTSTHDTKRSEDVRARLAALSECPDRWQHGLVRWNRLNRPRKQVVDGRRAPSRNDEYLFYQTLLGLWPATPIDAPALKALRERIGAYMLKAAREAKARTNWAHPNEAYESALARYVDRVLGSPRGRFVGEFGAFAASLVLPGLCNSLAQTLLKMTAPGIPDIYQGAERLVYTLVDPDNRRPVDFDALRAALADASIAAADRKAESARHEDLRSGRAKLRVVRTALELRKRMPDLYARGDYQPLEVTGPGADCVCAYARVLGTDVAITVVARFPMRWLEAGGPGFWNGTVIVLPDALTPNSLHELIGMREVATTLLPGGKRGLEAGALFASLPVALLTPH